jgi:ADP-ribosylglycohydrolase/catechol 2,3-dioxygenase-like lactoylglutathione lyase family enzyme
METIPLIEKAQAAFLGAAAGDALGWPHEQNAKRVRTQTRGPDGAARPDFRQWTRREGHPRFAAFEMDVRPGEYSDDTQLLLCVARSRLQPGAWWRHLSEVEFPFWTTYERGGGGATKRAAASWIDGRAPWHASRKPEDRHRYFEAGGNGVTMRILPHCLLAAQSSDFATLAHDIVVDGVCTHGHPRALVGALAYGFALWTAFRQSGTLSYGGLIEATRSGIGQWSSLPDITDVWPDWRDAAEAAHAGEYGDVLWHETVAEMASLLDVARDGLRFGALAVDHQVLERLGCFDRERNGAGTISAAAAIFLASMHAADPLNGIAAAAFAPNSDTDTLASMTGAILGAIAGRDWLGSLALDVQDARYLCDLAGRLVRHETYPGAVAEAVNRRKLKTFQELLERSDTGQHLRLPDSRSAEVQERREHQVLSGLSQAVTRVLRVADGQLIPVTTTRRAPARTRDERHVRPLPDQTEVVGEGEHIEHTEDVVSFRLRTPVRDLAEARDFYARVLGFPVAESDGGLRVGKWLVLIQDSNARRDGRKTRVTHVNRELRALLFEVRDVKSLYNTMVERGLVPLKKLTSHPRREYFQCIDPDGNVIELFERRNAEISLQSLSQDDRTTTGGEEGTPPTHPSR